MKPVRHGVLLALVLGSALLLGAAERTGPGSSEVIYPRGEAPAAESGAAGSDQTADRTLVPPTPTFDKMGPILGYIVVLALLLGGAWLLIKRGSLPRPFGRSEGKLRVLETRLLGNRQCLLVVEYEDARMLLGVCPGRIDYLTPLAGHPLAAAEAEIAAEGEDFNPPPSSHR